MSLRLGFVLSVYCVALGIFECVHVGDMSGCLRLLETGLQSPVWRLWYFVLYLVPLLMQGGV